MIIRNPDKKLVQSALMNDLTRDQLRYLARCLGIKRGRSKSDTINNLMESRKFHIQLHAYIPTS